jgi:hypothetical protein
MRIEGKRMGEGGTVLRHRYYLSIITVNKTL